MKTDKNHSIFLLGLASVLFFSPIKAFAFCPMCVVATGTFLGIFRWLGVDDAIIGLWLGGFITSLGVVLNNALIKKQKKIKFQLFLIIIGIYILTVSGLYLSGSFTSYNKIFGVNKIFFGMIIGNLLILSAPYFDKFLRRRNHGKIFIYYQKIIIAVALLLFFSLGLYFIL